VVDGHRGPGATHAINLGSQVAFGIPPHNTPSKKNLNQTKAQISMLAKSQAQSDGATFAAPQPGMEEILANETTEGGPVPASLDQFL